jgi:hypothetical protein
MGRTFRDEVLFPRGRVLDCVWLRDGWGGTVPTICETSLNGREGCLPYTPTGSALGLAINNWRRTYCKMPPLA